MGHVLTDGSSEDRVELDEARQREILALDQSLESVDHFALFKLPPSASAEEVKRAFYEASRQFHPDRFFGRSLGPFKGRIDRIFRRFSEAHQVLTDPARRAAYLLSHPELAPAPPAAEDPVRAAERRARLTRHPYLAKVARVADLIARAKGNIAKKEFGQAHADLAIALQIDERHAEVKQLLAVTRQGQDLQRAEVDMKRGDQALAAGSPAEALHAYRNASNLDPTNPVAAKKAAKLQLQLGENARVFAQRLVDLQPSAENHAFLAGILLDAGAKALAQSHYEAALKLDPRHPEAAKHVRKKKWF